MREIELRTLTVSEVRNQTAVSLFVTAVASVTNSKIVNRSFSNSRIRILHEEESGNTNSKLWSIAELRLFHL